MNKTEEISSQIKTLNKEFDVLTSLYNLHIIEIKNCFINSIIEAYSDFTKDKYNTATILNNNQITFYNTQNQEFKTINLSLKNFQLIWNLFLKNIEIISLKNTSKEFYNTLKSKDFMKVSIDRKTRRYFYFHITDKNLLLVNKVILRYYIRSKEEVDFIKNNDNLWIFMSQKILSKLNHNTISIKNNSKTITIDCSPFNKKFIYKVSQDLLNKIRDKTKNKINIKVVNINSDLKIVILKVNFFLPLEFIQYINNYIYTNTLYKVKFARIKDNK